MSTLKVNKLRDTAGSADAITLDPNGGAVLAGVTTVTSVKVGAAVTISESGIEASGIGITVANINGGQISGRRNKIINGDFTIHQRGGTITASGGTYTLDRWRSYITGDSPGGFTVQQSTGSYPQTNISGVKDNFKASALITVTSAGSAAANNNVKFQQRIEGSNVYDLALGTSAAKSFTVSFYVKSSLTGTFGASLVNSAHDRSNIQTYTVNSANTWEYKTFTVAGDTSGTWVTNTGTGLQLMFDLGSGSDKLTDTTNQWVAGEYHGTTSSVKLTHTNSATLQFAGVQLEAGTQATAFEHRSYGEELGLCQRYYYKHVDGNTKTVTENGTHYTGAYIFASFTAPTAMRTAPSIEVVTGSAYYVTHSNGQQTQTFSGTGVSSSYNTENYLSIQTDEGGGTQGHATIWRTNNASARIAYGAEL
jgi:hypothetical protein